MGAKAGLDGTRKIEGDADLVRPSRTSGPVSRDRMNARNKKTASVQLDVQPDREIILRLIELIKTV